MDLNKKGTVADIIEQFDGMQKFRIVKPTDHNQELRLNSKGIFLIAAGWHSNDLSNVLNLLNTTVKMLFITHDDVVELVLADDGIDEESFSKLIGHNDEIANTGTATNPEDCSDELSYLEPTLGSVLKTISQDEYVEIYNVEGNLIYSGTRRRKWHNRRTGFNESLPNDVLNARIHELKTDIHKGDPLANALEIYIKLIKEE